MADTILIANPTAQSGRAEARIARARELLDDVGLAHGFVPTEAAGGTIGAVRRAIEAGARRVVAMGGDGTFAEAAKGILASGAAAEVALGLLPMGTANDQGKSFGLGTGEAALAANVAVIAGGRVFDLDVGRAQLLDAADQVARSELFFDSFSVGLGAEVLAARNRDRAWAEHVPLVRALYRDQLVYAGALVKRLAASVGRGATFTLEVEVDGEARTYPHVIDVIVKNTPIYGGEWVLAPDAQADDGLLELVPICGLADFGTRMLTALRGSPIVDHDLRALGIEPARPVPGRHFELTIIQPGASAYPAAQVDGEELPPGDRFRIDVLPRILRVLVPQTFQSQGSSTPTPSR